MQLEKPYEVVTFGETMGLLLAEGVPLEAANFFTRSHAGAESNVATGLARLGHRVAWLGRVGADVFGRAALRALRADGVDVSMAVVDPDHPTGLLIRDAPNGRPVTVEYRRDGSAGSALCPHDLNRGAIAGAQALHLTAITGMLSNSAREATMAAIESARAEATAVIFDPNIRLRLGPITEWRPLIDILARHSTIVLVGADEAELISGERSGGWFLERGAELVVVKDGARGAFETDGSSSASALARPVPVVDPVGAGDAFAAGWISGWLRGLDPPARLREASVVASCVVASFGDIAGLPDARTRAALLDDTTVIDR